MTVPCPSCGHPATSEDRFCARCGTRLGEAEARRFCARCGAGLAPDAGFCAACGTPAPVPTPISASNGNGVAAEDEDLLAEWESAIRPFPATVPARMEDPAITETIVRTPPEPVTEALPMPTPVRVQPQPAARTPLQAPPRAEPRTPFRFPLGAFLALLGAVAVIVSAVLPWDGAFRASLPRDIVAARLLDAGAARDGVSLGIVLLIGGTLGALVALLTMAVPILKPLRRIVGLMCLSLPVLFAFRTVGPLISAGNASQLWSELGVGAYVAGGGAFVQIVAGRWFRR